MDTERLRKLAGSLMAIGAELMELADAKPEPEPAPTLDVIYLARAIQGEGAGGFGDQRDALGLWIGHTAMNRLEKGWWRYDTMVDVIIGAFHGYVNVASPAPWAIDLAYCSIHREEDIADGALFMLSGGDLKEHGWSASTAIKTFTYHGLTMYFFRLWPGAQDVIRQITSTGR
jgi:hypothetical protein